MSANQTGSPQDGAFTGAAADSALEDLRSQPVMVARPLRQTAPFIFASPHSGRLYPASFARQSRLDAVMLRKSEDAFVDELFASVPELGAPLIAARFPRAFVDANRASGEIDPAMFDAPLASAIAPRTPRVAAGLGVIPRIVRDGVEIYVARLPAQEAHFRLESFYRPYHAALAKLVSETRELFGIAIVIDCHSMPPPSRGSDIVIGDCYGEAAAAELIVAAQRALAELGFAVMRNTPYAGGYTTNLYGKPESGTHALQIEISRSLYLDEASMTKTAAFPHCKERLSRFAARLMGGSWMSLARRQAAE
ncbi:MAG TPA: N-formylglutamate amidohydrolase [Micropepsaceae bacterium]|jgi:N-formylglutamate deformylase|nr:N-formylglutamate amidohydrolase [Micropepsaceae bacterium]